MKRKLFFTFVIVLLSFLIPTNPRTPVSDGQGVHTVQLATAMPQPKQIDQAPVATVPVSPVDHVRAEAAKYGWSGGYQWSALDALIAGESGWRPYVYNSSSGACGLFQALPCSKLGAPLEDVSNQARWGLAYIKNRYGDPATAYATWLSRSPHWY